MDRQRAGKYDRRTFLTMLAAAGGVAVATPLLAACGSSAPPASGGAPAPAATSAPASGSAPATAATSAPAAAKPAKVVTLRTGSTLATDHPINTMVLPRWGENLAKQTNGAFKVEVQPNGALGSGRTGPESVSIGGIESFFADPSEYASFNQALNLLSAPFVWKDRNQLQKAVRDPDVYNTLYGPVIAKGIRALGIGYSGTRHLTTKTTAAKTPADLKGLKIRVPEIPVYKDMVAAWGATPTPIAMTDVFMALQTGTVDGQENPFAQIISSKFYEVQKDLILTAHITQCGSIIFNESLYQQQPKEYQTALVSTAQEALDWYMDYLGKQEDSMQQDLQQKDGMTIVQPDRNAFQAAMAPLYQKYDSVWTTALRQKVQSF